MLLKWRWVPLACVLLAGGLHPEIKARYFRIGHMGAVSAPDILTAIGAIETWLFRARVGEQDVVFERTARARFVKNSTYSAVRTIELVRVENDPPSGPTSAWR